ncbi:MAG: hypothetical protein LLG05_05770 [Porphyromonadaceae bacterium]|nr:hypothetical protein [Porphyromonadaceae bacterium]
MRKLADKLGWIKVLIIALIPGVTISIAILKAMGTSELTKTLIGGVFLAIQLFGFFLLIRYGSYLMKNNNLKGHE